MPTLPALVMRNRSELLTTALMYWLLESPSIYVLPSPQAKSPPFDAMKLVAVTVLEKVAAPMLFI
jgi:hypothetical protein